MEGVKSAVTAVANHAKTIPHKASSVEKVAFRDQQHSDSSLTQTKVEHLSKIKMDHVSQDEPVVINKPIVMLAANDPATHFAPSEHTNNHMIATKGNAGFEATLSQHHEEKADGAQLKEGAHLFSGGDSSVVRVDSDRVEGHVTSGFDTEVGYKHEFVKPNHAENVNVMGPTEKVNSAPVAQADNAGTIQQNHSVTLNVLTNDTDADGNQLTLTGVTNPSHGTVTWTSEGQVIYQPNPGTHGADSFTYTISDGQGGTTQATVTVNVNGTPTAQNDNAGTIQEDHSVTLNVLTSDTDADGNQLTLTGVTSPAHGTVTWTADGQVVYQPNAGTHGADSFTYTISDGQGGTSQATVTVNVNGTPVAQNDNAGTIQQDNSVTLNVLTNDTDADGHTLTLTGVTSPSHGTVSWTSDGQVIYQPNPGTHGADSFTYTISDGQGGTTQATVTVNVNGTPVAQNDNARTIQQDHSVTLNVLTNDTDADGNTLTLTGVTNPAHGTVTWTADGQLTYQPNAGSHGTDSFTYTISDGQGGTSQATVTINVNGTPVAQNDNVGTIQQDHSVTLNVLTNDTDADGNTLTLTGVTNPSHGTVSWTSDGQVIYQPNPGTHGADSFTYTISDGHGGTNTATVTVNVNGTPIAQNDNAGIIQQDHSVTLNVLANDTDADGHTLALTEVTNPSHGTVAWTSDGQVIYQPNPGTHGADSFTYTISDRHGGTSQATVTVNVNGTPVAQDDNAGIIQQDHSVTLNVLSNDTDIDGNNLSIQSVAQPAHGQVTINSDGTLNYTPATGYHGADSFTYTVSDGHGGTSTATATVTVVEANHAPVSNSDTGILDANHSVTINVLSNDADADHDALQVQSLGSPAHGTVTLNPNGTVLYTPTPNYHGVDSFTYTITDGKGGTSTNTVNITVNDNHPTAYVHDSSVSIASSLLPDSNVIVALNVFGNDASALQLEKNTLSAIGQQYFEHSSHSTVTVMLFSDNTYTVGTFNNINDLNSAISNIQGAGVCGLDPKVCNYNNALADLGNLVMSNQGSSLPNVSYFITHSGPFASEALSGSAVQYAQQNNTIYAVGVGMSASDSNLTAIATGGNALSISNNSDIANHFMNTSVGNLAGNIMTDFASASHIDVNSYGGESQGAHIYSVTIDGSEHVYDGIHNQLSTDLSSGGHLIFDFSTGNYEYTAPAGLNHPLSEDFGYTLVDGGGNMSTSEFSVHLVDGSVQHAAAADSSLTGTDQSDVLYGYSNSVNGTEGHAVLHGGNGSDYLYGGDGHDTLYGDGGSDTLYAGHGNNVLHGGDGNDILHDGSGQSSLYGESGNDSIHIQNSNFLLIDGGSGTDTLNFSAGNHAVGTLDLHAAGSHISNIEVLDMSDHDALDHLFLDKADVVALGHTNTASTLTGQHQIDVFVKGDANDSVHFGNEMTNWHDTGSTTSLDGITYHVWSNTTGGGEDAYIAIQQSLHVMA